MVSHDSPSDERLMAHYQRRLDHGAFGQLVARSKWAAEVSEEQNELCQPEMHLPWRLSDAHTLTWGMDLRHQKLDDVYTVIDGEPVVMAGFRARW